MADVIESARTLKSRAMDARDDEDFEGAISLLSQARRELERELHDLEPKRAYTGSPGRFEQEVAAQLAHILGSMGGVYRRQKKYPASIKFYDDGYNFEDPKAPYGIVNSYNLTQRLVSRVFLNPRAVDEPGSIVEGLPLKDALESARREIERQRAGSRREDEYAAADLAIVALLRGMSTGATSSMIFCTPNPSRNRMRSRLRWTCLWSCKAVLRKPVKDRQSSETALRKRAMRSGAKSAPEFDTRCGSRSSNLEMI